MKKVEINLGKGNLKEGFSSVLIEVFDESGAKIAQNSGISLARGHKIADAYRDWEFLYKIFANLTGDLETEKNPHTFRKRGIEIENSGVTNVSESNFIKVCKYLEIQLNQWLSPIEQELPLHIYPQEEGRILIITDDDDTRRLPWNLWHLFDNYPHVESAISGSQFQQKSQSRTPEGKVYILAIFGDSENIDLEPDRQALEALPNSNIEWLIEPTRERLNEKLWDKRGWDILFFAGHSQTLPEKAEIQINATDNLSLEQLKFALQEAIARGLQLAIFNSCDGLGLAKSLESLDVPQVIVMSQPVPDLVAQKFLKNFLTEFATGKSMYISERKAREQLQGIEEKYPCASWLPVIFQNPTFTPLTWEQLFQSSPPLELFTPTQPKISLSLPLSISAIASTIATILTITLRSLGLFQGLELQIYDHIMKMRPDEGIDPYITIVTTTEKDVEEYGGYPLPDATIARALAKIQTYQPEFIALDIFRDRPQQPGNKQLRRILANDKSIIAICSLTGFNDPSRPGIAPPPNLENYRIGFSEIAIDLDNVVRRHLLSNQPMEEDVCQTDMSLSTRLAFYYLDRHNIQPETMNQDVQIGKVKLKSLPNQTGGYQKLDNYGFQIMLNYRSGSKSFETISLQELFTKNIERNLMQGKIILIGMDAPISTPDYHVTSKGKLPGVTIHAHMTSQIINAVLKQRPLIKTLLPWQENILIGFGSIIGGFIVWRWYNLFKVIIMILLVTLIMYSLSWLALLQGLWLPIFPVMLSLIITLFCIYIYFLKPLQKSIRHS